MPIRSSLPLLTEATIVGIHDGHDASVAICRGGRILCAMAEERVQRIKSAGGLPLGALEACLKATGLDRRDIDLVAVAGTQPIAVNMLGTISAMTQADFVRVQEEIRRPQYYEGRSVPLAHVLRDYKPRCQVHYPLDRVPLKETREMTSAELADLQAFRHAFIAESCSVSADRVRFIDHHRAHAYHAYYASRYRDEPATVLTMDAGGDRIYDSVNHFAADGTWTRLHASHESIVGPLYTYVTLLLGMRPFEHEYKVMGLAPYAKDNVKARTREILINYMDLDGYRFRRNAAIKDLYWHTKEALKLERFDGIAGGLQDFAEHYLTRWTAAAVKATGVSKVAYGGGVALNVKANLQIANLPEVAGFAVPPGPGDESLPLGSIWALMDDLWPDGSPRRLIPPLDNGYLGPTVDDSEVATFRRHPLIESQFEAVAGDAEDLAAERVAQGGVVAVCRGRMEVGPRALGNRSLIADPSRPDVVRQINEAVKGRDFWMPFAPSVMAEDLPAFAEIPAGCEVAYMTACVPSTAAGRRSLAAATHPYDGTLRPQSVTREAAPAYHSLLGKVRQRLGFGAVLNTSLNIHGKPIVCTPTDMVEELLAEPGVTLDYLLVGDGFYRRRGTA